ncbi:MAG: acetyl-CoA carboxylase biotin carboxyl carrier protein [Elusimicrobiota bacterium]|jgi:acetyl-CoA carboxylase biotin carboxyl carrier protein
MVKKTKPTEAAPAADGVLGELQEIYGFMREHGLEALELDRKDYHVRLVRQGRPTAHVPVPVAMTPTAAHAAVGASAPAPAAALPANAFVVKSPMMGIFYRAASPSSPPFVKEGDIVRAGDVLCLIEAMKVFNDIKAERGGKILSIALENGKPVKAGAELFVLENV